MDFPLKTGEPARQRTECAILPVFDDGELRGATESARQGLARRDQADRPRRRRGGSARRDHVDSSQPRSRGPLAARRLRQARRLRREALGHRARCGARRAARQRHARSARPISPTAATRSASSRRPAKASKLRALKRYRFDELKSRREPPAKLARLGIGLPTDADKRAARRGIQVGTAIANGTDLARDLGNRPPNVCTPTHIAEAARALAKRFNKLEVKVLSEPDMRRLGMGAMLAVTQGADEPREDRRDPLSRRRPKAAPIAICGKGITFDTGGISIKPPPKMDEMKFDMCGAGGVLGAMAAIAELEPECNVVGVLPACENMPGGNATRARRHRHQHVGPDDRDPQHRRRRTPDPLRRAHVRATASSRAA